MQEERSGEELIAACGGWGPPRTHPEPVPVCLQGLVHAVPMAGDLSSFQRLHAGCVCLNRMPQATSPHKQLLPI